MGENGTNVSASRNDSGVEGAEQKKSLYSMQYELESSDRIWFSQSGDDVERIVMENGSRSIEADDYYDDGKMRVRVKFEKTPDDEFVQVTVDILDISVLPVIVEGIECDYTVGNGNPFDGTYNRFKDTISMDKSGKIQCKRRTRRAKYE